MNAARHSVWRSVLLVAWFAGLPAVARTGDASQPAFAVASLFRDHMVLQREKPVVVWGTAAPNAAVTVRFANQTKETRADTGGAWRLALDPMPASTEGRSLEVVAANHEPIAIKDVLVGEVWLASGQSNMGLAVESCLNLAEETAAANYPNLRFFTVPKQGAAEPQATTSGVWTAVSPGTVRSMSGAAYFFARAIHQKLDVPVGVIVSAVGATAAEQWASADVLRRGEDWNQLMTEQLAEALRNEEITKTFLQTLQAWRRANHCEDPEAPNTAWAAPDLDTSDWRKASGQFALGKTAGLQGGGVIWLRKEFDAPEDKAGKDTGLWVGELDHQIMTYYLNGKEIGTTGLDGPRFYQKGLFFFYVPKGIVQAGRNVLAIRCTTFTADTVIGVSGVPIGAQKDDENRWLIKAEVAFPVPSAEAVAALPTFTKAALVGAPTSLYNAMIHPLIPFTIRGAIWYQGESNVWRANRYQDLMTGLIEDWRARWGQGNFPFYLVQLANYEAPATKPSPAETPNAGDAIARLREAQLRVAQTLPESGLAVAIDIGEKDIHPRNKQDVGDRLARIALARTYGKRDIEWQSPLYDSMAREGSAIRVKFKDCPRGLMVGMKVGLEQAREASDGKLEQFAIAGADNTFVWAEARIEGDSVVVSSPDVPDPVAVRYAWSNNPEGCNLYGRNGLPASPFRTDSLPWPEKK